MFFMYESRAISRAYKSTPVAIYKNKISRKSGVDNPRSKKVCQLSLAGDHLRTYESMSLAASENRIFHSAISKCSGGKAPNSPQGGSPHRQPLSVAGGFYWCFESCLTETQQRCRFLRVMRQLLENVVRYEETPRRAPVVVAPKTDAFRNTVSDGMKHYYATTEGRQNKEQAHGKRSQTMKTTREAIRQTLTEKEFRVCKKILPVSSFCKKTAAVDGLQPYCKPCTNDDKKKTYQKASHGS